MANLFVSLDPGGAAADVSAQGSKKTIIVDKAFSGIVQIEANAGGGFVPVPGALFSAPGKRTIDIAAKEMRVAGGPSGAPDISVSANDEGAKFVNLPVGGAAVDVSDLGTFNSIYVDGLVGGLITVQTSEDSVHWVDCASFQNSGVLSKEFIAKYMRAQGSAGSVNVAAGNELSDSSAPIIAYVFRPGATGADAPGGNVYTDEDAIIAAIASTKNNGHRFVEFDSRFSTDLNAVTLSQVCLITKEWDMADVTVTARIPSLVPPSGSTFEQTFIEFQGDGAFVNLGNIFGRGLTIFGNSRTRSSIPLDPGVVLQVRGTRCFLQNTDALALPLFECTGDGSFAIALTDNTGSAIGGFAYGGSLAPTLKVVSGQTAILVNTNGYLIDDALTGDGICLLITETSGAQNAPTDFMLFPTFDADGGTFIFISDQAPRCQIFNGIFTADGDAVYSDLTRVDSSAALADIVITLPPAGPRQGEFVAVKDVGGTANVVNQAIVVTAAVGDLIDGAASVTINTAFGALELRNDGGTDWWTI